MVKIEDKKVRQIVGILDEIVRTLQRLIRELDSKLNSKYNK